MYWRNVAVVEKSIKFLRKIQISMKKEDKKNSDKIIQKKIQKTKNKHSKLKQHNFKLKM